jgi:hypothetical protein
LLVVVRAQPNNQREFTELKQVGFCLKRVSGVLARSDLEILTFIRPKNRFETNLKLTNI